MAKRSMRVVFAGFEALRDPSRVNPESCSGFSSVRSDFGEVDQIWKHPRQFYDSERTFECISTIRSLKLACNEPISDGMVLSPSRLVLYKTGLPVDPVGDRYPSLSLSKSTSLVSRNVAVMLHCSPYVLRDTQTETHHSRVQ